MSPFLNTFLKMNLCVCVCVFLSVYECTTRVQHHQARRGHWIPWKGFGWLEAPQELEIEPPHQGPLQEQQVLTTDPPPQLHPLLNPFLFVSSVFSTNEPRPHIFLPQNANNV